ncbi:MAG: primosomal protein N' [Candidatus Marinimicrobia bacterium]|nr:primosomal protein N' [Candidatus Neomarinimicrobiota bacterium]
MEYIFKKLLKKESYGYAHLRNQIGREGFDSAIEGLTKAGAAVIEQNFSGYDGIDSGLSSENKELQMEEILLTKAQAEVYSPIHDSIESGGAQRFLLHGVTGSGKTEMYLRAARETLALGGTVLILVPEIALTAQIAERFGKYFSSVVSVYHSNQTSAERRKIWERIKSGESEVVVGARSAIFAPLKNLKLLIVDEEQEPSYKQAEPDPRYNARDAAVMRAKMEGATLILGSATPSLESIYNARKGKYIYLRLKERFGKAGNPKLNIVNLEAERHKGGYSSVVLSSELRKNISERLKSGEQIILLQNRRGFAPQIRCRECGHSEECPNCNVTFTYHSANNCMSCHYCGKRSAVPYKCPECGDKNLLFQGVGTQRVEKELNIAFPKAKVSRMDMDTTKGRGAHWRILHDFKAGKQDILLGTQMIAKGLDFDNVTLVGIISADTGLYLPDFRASERTFQLISQVAGRAGRRKKQGQAIVQTFNPDKLPVKSVSSEEQEEFYEKLLKERKLLDYPPFGRLIVLETSALDQRSAKDASKKVGDLLKIGKSGYEVLGPAPAVIEKLRKRYRWRIMVRISESGTRRLNATKKIIKNKITEVRKTLPGRVRLSIDVDPVNML